MQHLERYLKKTYPEVAKNPPTAVEPVQFADNSTKVTLVLPTEKPGFLIVPDRKPEVFNTSFNSMA